MQQNKPVTISDRQNLRKIFDSFDLDKNGTIELKQLGKVASQLGQTISDQQLKTIVTLLDVNKDGKISYDEFQYWWIKGKKGKLMKLVQLKAHALKLKKFIQDKFDDAKITLQDHKGAVKPDIFDFMIRFGEAEKQGVNISSSFYVRGQKQAKLLSQIQAIAPLATPKTVGLLFKLPSNNPEMAKTQLDLFVNDVFTSEGFPIPIQSLSDNQLFNYSTQIQQNCLIVTVFLKQEILQAGSQIMASADAVINKMGENFYALSNIQFNINASVDDILDQTMVDCLLKGFSFSFYTQANCSSLQKLRKLAQKQKSQLPAFINLLTLIRGSKFHWKLKTPQQVDKFVTKMGIKDSISEMPVLADMLQQMTHGMTKNWPQNSPLHFLKALTRFALKHIQNNIQIYHLDGNTGCGVIKLNAKNVTRFHSIIFNEV